MTSYVCLCTKHVVEIIIEEYILLNKLSKYAVKRTKIEQLKIGRKQEENPFIERILFVNLAQLLQKKPFSNCLSKPPHPALLPL